MSRMCGPARAMHTARIMFSDLYVTKRSGFQRLQGDRVDSTVVVGWRARWQRSAEVTCRWHRGIAAFLSVADEFGGSKDDDDVTTVLFS